MKKNKYTKVKASLNKGDFVHGEKYYEIKSTLLDATNENANITNIRNQEIEGYYILVINAENYEDIKTHCFYLDKNKMKKECNSNNASPMNGTSQANKGNKNIPLRFSINIGSDVFKKWEKKYLCDDLKLD